MLEYDYPDVLGAIAGGERLELPTLQCAMGVYPSGVAVGQPLEILLILQSVIEQPQEVMIAVRVPRKDASGRRLSFFLPKKQFKVRLGAAEVGVLQLPLIVQPPTPPAKGYPVILRVVAETAARPKRIREKGTGRPPSTLSVSPFRLEVLKEVPFVAEGSRNQFRCRFDVIPGKVSGGLYEPEPRYEALWSKEEYRLDRERIEAGIERAEMVGTAFTKNDIFYHIEEATMEHFAGAGLPLHPGEARFIAKTLTYIFDDAYQFEQDFDLRDARWFQWLTSLIMQDETAEFRDHGELAAGELYFGAMYDAVRLGLGMVELVLEEELGDEDEHRTYADRAIQAVQGNAPMDLSYAYLPLVMAGLLLHLNVELRGENLWESLEQLEEARRGRTKLAGADQNLIFKRLDVLIERTKDELRRARVPRE